LTEDEQIKMAFDYASEKTKQMITLATGIITVTISFSKELLGPTVIWTVIPLLAAWICYLLSIWYGVRFLGRVAGQLVAAPPTKEILEKSAVTKPAKLQASLFIWGLSLTIAFGLLSVGASALQSGGRMHMLGAATPCAP
jgi:hypothetical protein